MTAPFSYDVVDYPSGALPQAHPGALHAVARMFGADSAPVERCRYLEVGCGEGTNLIGCAVELPDATFVGADLSAVAVGRGNRLIAELGLTNVTLHAADLTTWEPPAGVFDYAAAHGLYSWVPAPVRDALLALFARVLAPTGVAYVSYNTYPGCYVRRMLWEILRFHTEDITDPQARIQQARELTKFLAAAKPANPDAALALLGPELTDVMESRPAAILYHDDLAAVNDPVYFHEFAAHAGRHGLRFVAEAEQHTMTTRAYPPAVTAVLDGFADRDVLAKEQYVDFLRLRRFRQTLLAPDGRTPQKDPDPARVTTLAASGRPEVEPDPVDLAPGVPVKFKAASGAAVRIDLPVAKAALAVLAERWPGRVWFDDLVRAAASKLDRGPTADDAEATAATLTRCWATGLIELHGDCPRYVETASERPVASPLARLQARDGPFVTAMLHTTFRLDDEASRRLVQVLDGSRDRDQLVAEILASVPPENRPASDVLRGGIDRMLTRFARAGLLVG